MRAKRVETKRRSRPLRRESDEHLWFVTARVAEARYWLNPILTCDLQPAKSSVTFERPTPAEEVKNVTRSRSGSCTSRCHANSRWARLLGKPCRNQLLEQRLADEVHGDWLGPSFLPVVSHGIPPAISHAVS